MSVTLPPGRRFAQRLQLHGEDWLLLAMLAVLFVLALAGAFTHMHDWTVDSIDAALREVARRNGSLTPRVTPDWFGWTNAVTSEITPSAALLMIRKRQRQGRPVGPPAGLFVGSSALSLLAQLSATGVDVPYAAQILVCLPAVSLTVLAVFKFSDMSYTRGVAAEAEAAAELAARKAARDAELKAELAERRAAELAAAERREAAELAAAERREAAELAAAERREAAELERLRIAAEQEGMTQRARIEAEERERQAARAEAERVEAARVRAAGEAEAARITAEAEARRVKAEAARIAAEAEAARQAAARLAALPAPAEAGADDAGRSRRPRQETAALVAAVLAQLPAGTDRPGAVAEVAQRLGVTAKYAREFVPEGFVAGASSVPGAAHGLRLVATGRG